MRKLWGHEGGQALLIALAFMFLATPLTISALDLAGTLAIDARERTRILKSQYSSIGGEQYALHILLDQTSAFTTSTTLNGETITTTVVQLDTPPGPLPFPPSADANRRLFTFQEASPTTLSTSSATTTFTITVENKDDKPVSISKIIDELADNFSYVGGSTVMKNASSTVVSTADPSITQAGQKLTWTVSGVTLAVGTSMTLAFVATAPSVEAIYCNEAYVLPGGKITGTGKSAGGRVTVGSPSETLCEGDALTITKTVSPDVVFGDTSTVYTYTIPVVNEGTTVLEVTRIDDTLQIIPATYTMSYKALSASSTPVSLAPGEPKTTKFGQSGGVDVYTMDWTFTGGSVIQIPTSTTWTIQFKTEATLPRGQFFNETALTFTANKPLPQTTWPTALITVIDIFRITVTDGQTTEVCDVWIGAEFDGTPFYVVKGCTITVA